MRGQTTKQLRRITKHHTYHLPRRVYEKGQGIGGPINDPITGEVVGKKPDQIVLGLCQRSVYQDVKRRHVA